MEARQQEKLPHRRFRWTGVGLLVLLLGFIGLGLVTARQWLAIYQGDRFLSVSLFARSTADYSKSWPTALVAQVDSGIIGDVIRDSQPEPEDLPNRLASATAMLLTPVPTATLLPGLATTQSDTRVPATERPLKTFTNIPPTSANVTRTSLPTIPPTAPATRTSFPTIPPTAPNPTPKPTSTAVPSSTPKPTNTPDSLPTNTRKPTNTRRPPNTRRPTKTPKPRGQENEWRFSETALGTIGKQIPIGAPDYVGLKTIVPPGQAARNSSDSPQIPGQDFLFFPKDWAVGLVWTVVLFLLLATARRLLNPYGK